MGNVVEDTMRVSRGVGYDYLLVDRCCIRKLNKDVLHEQLKKMGLLYPVWSIVRPVRPQPYGRTGRANSLDGRTGCFIILGWVDWML